MIVLRLLLDCGITTGVDLEKEEDFGKTFMTDEEIVKLGNLLFYKGNIR